HNRYDFAGVSEPDFSFCRMNVYVHLRSRNSNKNNGDRIFSTGYEGFISRQNNPLKKSVPDGPAVYIKKKALAVRSLDVGRRKKTRDAYSVFFKIDRSKRPCNVRSQHLCGPVE